MINANNAKMITTDTMTPYFVLNEFRVTIKFICYTSLIPYHRARFPRANPHFVHAIPYFSHANRISYKPSHTFHTPIRTSYKPILALHASYRFNLAHSFISF